MEKYIPQNNNIYKYTFLLIDMKTIKLSEKHWKKLMLLKLKEGYKSIDEIVGIMLSKKEVNQNGKRDTANN